MARTETGRQLAFGLKSTKRQQQQKQHNNYNNNNNNNHNINNNDDDDVDNVQSVPVTGPVLLAVAAGTIVGGPCGAQVHHLPSEMRPLANLPTPLYFHTATIYHWIALARSLDCELIS